MKAVKQRAKSKKSNARFARVKFPNNKESGENANAGPDLSHLRKPIDISESSLLQVTKLLETGGDEIKSILSYECDVVYECRICRSLFRSLANFISHKRVYCREKFNISLCRKTRNTHIISAETFVASVESLEDNNDKEDDNNIRILRSQAVTNSPKKDLTSVLDMLQRKCGEDGNENLLEDSSRLKKSNSKLISEVDLTLETDKAVPQILLEPIESTKTAVYQTATAPTVRNSDPMKTQITELQNMVDRDTAILNPDGRSIDPAQLEKSDSPLQIYGSDDEEEEMNASANCARNLVCSVCNAKFATRKTLTYHMKSLHVSYRTCYPCPCCDSSFANTWSVYRHLFKIHRKTNVQVRKLRTQIQEKAFRKETTGAEDIEKENALTKSSSSPNLQTNNKTQQEWMEHFELDLELQRCGGCGRRFDRRAALISHSQLCLKRMAACNEANKSKRLSKTPSPKNLVEDNNSSHKESKEDRGVSTKAQTSKKKTPRKSKVQVMDENLNDRVAAVTQETELLPEVINNSELSIRVENVSRISDADWEMMERNVSTGTLSPTSDISIEKEQKFNENGPSISMNIPDSPEIIYTSIDETRTVAISFGGKKRRVSLINNSKELTNSPGSDLDSSPDSGPGSVSGESTNALQNSPTTKDNESMKTNHMALMENRIATIANLRKLQCLPCRRKFTSMTNLRRHMAVHIGWHRYKCKLCDFKCFVKCDCVAHCNKFHDAKNNRSIIADMVVQIPPDQSILAQEIMMDLSGTFAANSEPELIDVTESSPKSIEADDSNSNESLQQKLNESEVQQTQENDKEEKKDSDRKLKTADEHKSPEKVTGAAETQDPARGRLDKDPDLRKMVMEVIFGTGESDTGGVSDLTDLRKGAGSLEGKDTISETKESSAKRPTEGKKSTTKVVKGIKRQRPTRNRVKPVNEDFIYDLTELIRKESANHRAAAIATQKTLKKKHLVQQQAIIAGNEANGGGIKSSESSNNNEVQKLSSSYKLPNILSHYKKIESNDYNVKLPTLKQAEIRLIDASNGIMSSKSFGSTKISVSSQK